MGERNFLGERGLEGTRIGWHRLDRLVVSCKLASDMLLVKGGGRGRGRGSKKTAVNFTQLQLDVCC